MITPYLKLPLCLPGQLKRDGTYTDDKIVTLEFFPNQVAAYHESFYNQQTVIYLANGQPFIIDLSVEEYKAQITGYWDALLKEQNIKAKGSEIKRKLGMIN